MVYFIINKVPLEERRKMTLPQLLVLVVYHGTTSGNGSSRFAAHVGKKRFDPEKHGMIVFASWNDDNLGDFESAEEVALAWELKIDTLKPLFLNYDLSLSYPGCSVRALNKRLIEKLDFPEYTTQVVEKTIEALQHSEFIEAKIKEIENDEQSDVSFAFKFNYIILYLSSSTKFCFLV